MILPVRHGNRLLESASPPRTKPMTWASPADLREASSANDDVHTALAAGIPKAQPAKPHHMETKG